MEKVAQKGASYFILLPKYYKADQIKENEVDGTCGTHGRGKDCVQGLMGKPEGKRTLGRTIGSEWILGRLAGGVQR
jgi:hypothetical protein